LLLNLWDIVQYLRKTRRASFLAYPTGEKYHKWSAARLSAFTAGAASNALKIIIGEDAGGHDFLLLGHPLSTISS